MHYELMVTQECYNRCVKTLESKALLPTEEACVAICAQKYADAKALLVGKYFNKFTNNFVSNE